MGTIAGSPLGKAAHYADAYDASLLYPVEREPARQAIGLDAASLPFAGADAWTAWELSWLDPSGKPQVAVATFEVPCDSPRIVESKSVKLYLAALNGSRFPDGEALRRTIARDLCAATGASVDVALHVPSAFAVRAELDGEPLDAFALPVVADAPDAALLRAAPSAPRAWTTRLFRSVCPVTGQPDYADVMVRCEGASPEPASLLAYLVAYRRHPGFHEHCVERIFVDVMRACRPRGLAVVARFTRRGGVDINPWRSSIPGFRPPRAPTARQ